MSRLALGPVVLFLMCSPASAQSLGLVEEVEWSPFRRHCLDLLKGLDSLGNPLPAATVKALRVQLDRTTGTSTACQEVQKLLDAHCLVGVHINPESRVKAARGASPASLKQNEKAYVLVKVHNEGGVTHPLAVSSDQAHSGAKKEGDRWLELTILNTKPFGRALTGRRLEYRVLQLTARQAGKREATLVFDVGQGTQDLGYRAEVPILFRVRTP